MSPWVNESHQDLIYMASIGFQQSAAESWHGIRVYDR